MTRGDLVLVDTNVYLSATDRSRPDHQDSQDFLRRCAGAGIHSAITGQIVREYLVAATRPLAVNGLGLQPLDALSNVETFRSRAIFLDESETVSRRLEDLVKRLGLNGKKIHDANIAAVLAVYNVPYLITANTDDFAPFEHIAPLTPAEALAALPGG